MSATAAADESEYDRAIHELEQVLQRSRDREAFCLKQRDKLIALADCQQERRDEAEGQDRIGAATIAKLYDTALKYDRAAAEEHPLRFA